METEQLYSPRRKPEKLEGERLGVDFNFVLITLADNNWSPLELARSFTNRA